jgi:hypothetical protein
MTWTSRILHATAAFVGTAVYAASFLALPDPRRLFPVAAAIGVAAGLSWPVFGAALRAVTGGRPSACDWAEACLTTMTYGIAVLTVAAGLNLIVLPSAPPTTHVPVHAGLLIVSNLLMAAVFVGAAGRLGLTVPAALGLWVAGLIGPFAAVLTAWEGLQP